MYMIEISESKIDKMSECVEDMLMAGGELMHCLEKLKEESGMGERGGSYGNRGDYGGRSMMGSRGGYGNRDDEWDDDDEMMGERRRRSRRTGRYM